MAKQRVHALVSGRVQGVFFRAETEHCARELGMVGWVRNLRDGRVEAVFEGEEADVQRMLAFVRAGPEFAQVTDVEISIGDYSGEFDTFRVLPTG